MALIEKTAAELTGRTDPQQIQIILRGFAIEILRQAMKKMKASIQPAAHNPRKYRSVPSNGLPTSDDAAEAITPHRQAIRQRILDYIKARDGATMDEICIALGIPTGTACPRLAELSAARHINRTGETRMTRANRKALVWYAV